MKQVTIWLLLLLSLSSAQLTAQSEFLPIEQVYEQAAEEDKLIMMVFSGSDWCKPCIALKEQILSSKAFTTQAEQLIMLYLDFPYKKANQLSKEERTRNELLAEEYNADGQFPRLVFVDANEAVVSEISYTKSMTAESFVEDVQRIINAYETN